MLFMRLTKPYWNKINKKFGIYLDSKEKKKRNWREPNDRKKGEKEKKELTRVAT